MSASCHFCGCGILDSARIYARVSGWQTKGTGESRKSGSDIVLREPTGEVACAACITRLKAKIPAGQESFDIDLTKRTDPLCVDCFAEITWISLPRNGSRMSVDRKPLRVTDPRRGLVLVDPNRPQGVVLKQSDLEGARKRIAQGARLHYPHAAKCSARRRAAA